MNPDFIKTTLALRGKAKGQKWLDNLPELIKTYEKKWGLKSIGTFPNLSINFIEKVKTKNGEELVLKIGFPGPEFLREASALETYNGNGAVRVLNSNLEDCVLLLEGCLPGVPLSSLNNEEKEVLIFTNISKRVWTKAPQDSIFRYLSTEIRYFDWYSENSKKAQKYLPEALVIKAKEKFQHLIATQKDEYLLHGDLHHDNILSSDRGWLSIDPKGMIGEREYESSTFIINPFERFENNQELINKDFFATRIELIATALRFDKKRITDWAFVKQILSLIWSIQDNQKVPEYRLKIAKELEQLV